MPTQVNPFQGELLKEIDRHGKISTQYVYQWFLNNRCKGSSLTLETCERYLRDLVGKRLLNGTIRRETINGKEVALTDYTITQKGHDFIAPVGNR